MFSFVVKDSSADIDIVVTRSLLALSGLASLMYHTDQYYFVNVISAILLFGAAVFVKILITRFNINKLLLLGAAALLLFASTHSFLFALILVLYSFLVRYFYKIPVIDVTTEGIFIKKALSSPHYEWSELTNVVYKDNLLTIDFQNNNLLQLSIDTDQTSVDETLFNNFCARQINPLSE